MSLPSIKLLNKYTEYHSVFTTLRYNLSTATDNRKNGFFPGPDPGINITARIVPNTVNRS